MTDFLEEKRREIADRLKELKPLLEEHSRLEAAASALAGLGGPAATGAASAPAPHRKKGPGRPLGSSTGKKGPGRPRGSGKRASKVAAATTSVSTPAASTVATEVPKKPGRPKGSGRKVGRPKGSGKRVGRPKGSGGRPKGSGKRATEALSLVQGQPGITIPELAAKMGIKQNYLYRVLPGLEREGKLEKKGRGWYQKAT